MTHLPLLWMAIVMLALAGLMYWDLSRTGDGMTFVVFAVGGLVLSALWLLLQLLHALGGRT